MSSETYLPPPPSKHILFLLAADTEWLEKAKSELVRLFGPVEQESSVFLYKATDYYCEEMGNNIIRQFLSFRDLLPPEGLADYKLKTNEIEMVLSEEGKRQVNLDGGLLTLDKIVIATTKPASYRVYLREGIYAQATYWYEKATYQAWPWTYDEYQSSDIIEFFNSVRRKYQKQLNELKVQEN